MLSAAELRAIREGIAHGHLELRAEAYRGTKLRWAEVRATLDEESGKWEVRLKLDDGREIAKFDIVDVDIEHQLCELFEDVKKTVRGGDKPS